MELEEHESKTQGPEDIGPYRPEDVDLEEEAKLLADGVGENFKRYKDQSVACLPQVVTPIERFEDAIESKLLLKNVVDLKYNEMTPIQKWAIPAIMEGRDIIGCAQTGSGKTAAFLLPILQNILKMDIDSHDPNDDCQHPYCLILSPTRELARQIHTQAMMLSRDSIVKCCVIYGQISTAHLKAQLSKGCHVLVATLGRLKDFVERNWIAFKRIKYIVLDEGDRLVDDGFKGDIAQIFEHETMPPKPERQTLFFSATFKKDFQANARQYLGDNFVFLAVGKVGSSNEDIKQEFLQVSRPEKKQKLREILKQLEETEKAIIFTQTKSTADFLAGFFTSLNLPAASIHGDRHQYQRDQAIALFRRGDRRFLISSPVGNRGLDLPKVAIVINYDLPDNIDEYVHRIGRTGRAGHTGRAISFVDLTRDGEIMPDLIKNLTDAKQEIPDWLVETPQQVSTNGDDWVTSDWTNTGGGGGGSETAAGVDDWTNTGGGGNQAASGNDDWTNTGGGGSETAAGVDDWTNTGGGGNQAASGNDDWTSTGGSGDQSSSGGNSWNNSGGGRDQSSSGGNSWNNSGGGRNQSSSGGNSWGNSGGARNQSSSGGNSWGNSGGARNQSSSGGNSWNNSGGARNQSSSGENSWGNSGGARNQSSSGGNSWGNSGGARNQSSSGGNSWNNSGGARNQSSSGGNSWGNSGGARNQSSSGGNSWNNSGGARNQSSSGGDSWTNKAGGGNQAAPAAAVSSWDDEEDWGATAAPVPANDDQAASDESAAIDVSTVSDEPAASQDDLSLTGQKRPADEDDAGNPPKKLDLDETPEPDVNEGW